MRPSRTFLPVVLVATMILSMAPASAEVHWDHTLTDPGDDVVSVLEPTVKLSDIGEVDILSASVTEQGDDLNVTLTLAGSRSPEATYEVTITCDGDEAMAYTFTYSFGVFNITGPDLAVDDPEAYLSSDLDRISWVLAKGDVTALQAVEVTHAQAMVFLGTTNYIDTVPGEGIGGGNGNGGGGSQDPVNVQVAIGMMDLAHVRYTIQVTIEGEDAKNLRGEFDLDADGAVTKEEYDQHMTVFYLTCGSWNSTDLRLDGEAPTSRAMTFELNGVVGSSTSTTPVDQVVTLDVRFDEPGASTTHTYADFSSTTDQAGDMWDVTADSLWTMSAPPGWRFKTDDWPSGTETYLGSKGSTVTLSGLQMRSDWNGTVGLMNSVVVTEKGLPTEDDSPGFGAVASVACLIGVSTPLVTLRRRL